MTSLPITHTPRHRANLAASATIGALLFSGGYVTGAASRAASGIGSPVARSHGSVAQTHAAAPAPRRIAQTHAQTHA